MKEKEHGDSLPAASTAVAERGVVSLAVTLTVIPLPVVKAAVIPSPLQFRRTSRI